VVSWNDAAFMPISVMTGDVIVGESSGSWDPEIRESMAFANPKSSTLTVPSARTLMVAGFRSRWMMPWSCAAAGWRARRPA
jgi:hypothetical protein